MAFVSHSVSGRVKNSEKCTSIFHPVTQIFKNGFLLLFHPPDAHGKSNGRDFLLPRPLLPSNKDTVLRTYPFTSVAGAKKILSQKKK
jgi:hypothetical protein